MARNNQQYTERLAARRSALQQDLERREAQLASRVEYLQDNSRRLIIDEAVGLVGEVNPTAKGVLDFIMHRETPSRGRTAEVNPIMQAVQSIGGTLLPLIASYGGSKVLSWSLGSIRKLLGKLAGGLLRVPGRVFQRVFGRKKKGK